MIDLQSYADQDIFFSPLQRKLLEILEKNGPMTRPDLIKSLDYPRTTIYDNLMRLSGLNLVKKFTRPTNIRGRPLVFFKLIGDE